MDAAAGDLHHIRPWRRIERRKSRKILVGNVEVGGDAPITVQSMTNTPTPDAKATIDQIRRLEETGADIVRVSCPDEDSTAALAQIVRAAKVPIVADIHFHYKRAIEAAMAGAACLRINPGNIGNAQRVKEVVQAAKDHGCAMRIGVNAGSLENHLLEKYGEPCPQAMVESALYHANLLEEHGFRDYKISVKASDVFLTAAAYQALAEATDAPLHLGVTEAGALRMGTIKSSIAMGSLLWGGIGDTIRVSLAADPVEEIKVGNDLLKSMGLRHRGVTIIACPSCARQGYDVITTVDTLEKRLAHIPEPITLSIIGCVVNGPGEALMTDLGFTGGGKGAGMVYVAGKADHKVDNEQMIDHIVDLVEDRARTLRAVNEAREG
jgi:(E)-4-hydroxy-3-methylbut-2-enyl-diphosphate synthase